MKAIKSPKRYRQPSIVKTTALSDIVFILLCFFIVNMEMVEQKLRVRTIVPSISELSKIEHPWLNSYIYIGPKSRPFFLDGQVRMQLNDAFAEPKDIMQWAKIHDQPWEVHNKRRVSLQVDKSVKMGVVNAVKRELRKANLRKVYYMATHLGM